MLPNALNKVTVVEELKALLCHKEHQLMVKGTSLDYGLILTTLTETRRFGMACARRAPDTGVNYWRGDGQTERSRDVELLPCGIAHTWILADLHISDANQTKGQNLSFSLSSRLCVFQLGQK